MKMVANTKGILVDQKMSEFVCIVVCACSILKACHLAFFSQLGLLHIRYGKNVIYSCIFSVIDW